MTPLERIQLTAATFPAFRAEHPDPPAVWRELTRRFEVAAPDRAGLALGRVADEDAIADVAGLVCGAIEAGLHASSWKEAVGLLAKMSPWLKKWGIGTRRGVE